MSENKDRLNFRMKPETAEKLEHWYKANRQESLHQVRRSECLRKKKIAMGHKWNDHEDKQNHGMGGMSGM